MNTLKGCKFKHQNKCIAVCKKKTKKVSNFKENLLHVWCCKSVHLNLRSFYVTTKRLQTEQNIERKKFLATKLSFVTCLVKLVQLDNSTYEISRFALYSETTRIFFNYGKNLKKLTIIQNHFFSNFYNFSNQNIKKENLVTFDINPN